MRMSSEEPKSVDVHMAKVWGKIPVLYEQFKLEMIMLESLRIGFNLALVWCSIVWHTYEENLWQRAWSVNGHGSTEKWKEVHNIKTIAVSSEAKSEDDIILAWLMVYGV